MDVGRNTPTPSPKPCCASGEMRGVRTFTERTSLPKECHPEDWRDSPQARCLDPADQGDLQEKSVPSLVRPAMKLHDRGTIGFIVALTENLMLWVIPREPNTP